MATFVITPEMQRANAEALLGQDPGKFRDPGQRWTAKRFGEIQRLLKQTEADRPVTILNLNPFPLKINGGVYFPDEVSSLSTGKTLLSPHYQGNALGTQRSGLRRAEHDAKWNLCLRFPWF